MKCPQCPYYEQKTSCGVELIKCNNKCGKAETMTNEQAIKVLNMVEAHGSLVIQAKEMAIKALEQEPCGKDINVPTTDAISRQAVLDKLNRLIEVERLQGTDEMGYGRERVSAYECMIHAVESEYLYPTIQPQPKTGWIPVSERLPEMYTYTLWCASSGYVRSDYFNGEFWEDAKKYCYEIIAWMPLPEPYKAESERENDN